MINYNPKEWTTFIFKFHKADTFRQLLPMMIYVSIYSAIICYLETVFFNFSMNSYLKNMSLIQTLLGFALSMLLVFRTNTAYERWWEGRKLWGSLVNSSRNLSIKINNLLDDENEKAFFMVMIPNFAFSLKNHLRNTFVKKELQNAQHFDVDLINSQKHIPILISNEISQKVHLLNKTGKLSNEHLLYINAELQNFCDVLGACERIKNSPIPFSYSVFLKKFIFFYVMTLPIGYVFSLSWFIIPVIALIFYALASLELIAEEIENPFGSDPNDLPLEQICTTIKNSVVEILYAPK
jgi:putative membrane protein